MILISNRWMKHPCDIITSPIYDDSSRIKMNHVNLVKTSFHLVMCDPTNQHEKTERIEKSKPEKALYLNLTVYSCIECSL